MFNRVILRSRDEFHSLILRSDKRRGEGGEGKVGKEEEGEQWD